MPLYFQEPKQLLDIFTSLEESNLFLIQNSQVRCCWQKLTMVVCFHAMPNLFWITFGLAFDQDTEQALEELQQKFAVLRKTREASAMASATKKGLFPLITLNGFLRNSFANDGKLLSAHHPGHEQQDASSNFSAWTTNLRGKEQVRRAKTEAWSTWFSIETSWQVFVVRPPRSTMGTNDGFKDIQ